MELAVLHTMRKHPPRHGYLISSFLPGVLRKLHALDSSLVLGALADTPWQLRRWRTLPVRYVVPHYRLLSARLIERLHATGRSVVTWTVNDRRHMLRAVELGVDGIISDDTKLLVKTLG
jgi:glycerophosphoryl diester phosphodiesterase